ncbi:hypothetical protein FN846DRAFT_939549 [Sphaerosporella brunnea]|uniref:Uncharacterized protein n=1 Tax=Sphaerosporella brunnea TaxID=1250544 RepID=A0A5J5F326_9PEZI|nr:hypothetical protein FN846DRAFT_939549 [Sphaerosporella brunnea]
MIQLLLTQYSYLVPSTYVLLLASPPTQAQPESKYSPDTSLEQLTPLPAGYIHLFPSHPSRLFLATRSKTYMLWTTRSDWKRGNVGGI